MRIIFTTVFGLLLSASLLTGQELKVYDTFDEFEEVLKKDDGKIHVVNFWATWCAPCVKEIPFFEELGAKYDNVEVTLVSIDFKNTIDRRVKPFLAKKNFASQVVLLGDPKPNDWIDRVDPSWSGAIPATYVYRGDTAQFYEQEFHSLAELEAIIHPFIKSK